MFNLLCAVAVLFPALYVTACQHDAFRFQIAFPEAPDVKEGAQVRYLGIEVGSVEKVTVNSEAGDASPHVVVSVVIREKKVHIRQNDKFAIATAGLLGEAFVDIRPGPASAPNLAAGTTMPGEVYAGSLKSLSEFLTGIGVSKKFELLPPQRREVLIKSFNEMVDSAIEEELRKPDESHRPAEPKK